jgi:hypothetical protein
VPVPPTFSNQLQHDRRDCRHRRVGPTARCCSASFHGEATYAAGRQVAYTAKQRRQAELEEGYRRRGVTEKAERRAWATENAMTGGGRELKSASARKAASTRKRARSRSSTCAKAQLESAVAQAFGAGR